MGKKWLSDIEKANKYSENRVGLAYLHDARLDRHCYLLADLEPCQVARALAISG